MNFLRVFQSVLHALEAASTIAAPFVSAVDPTIGKLMGAATTAAVLVEATATVPGDQKAALVAQATQAGIDLTNQLLASQGKAPLPANIAGVVATSTKLVVDTLKGAADTVDPLGAMKTPAVSPIVVAAAAK